MEADKEKEFEKKFFKLFDLNPVSLWEEDISNLKALLDKKKKEVENLKLYLDSNPDFVEKCAKTIIIKNVNKVSLDLFGFKSKDDLASNISKNFNDVSYETFKNELCSIANNLTEFRSSTEFVKTDGTILPAIIQLVIIDDFKTCIVSITDISKQKEEEEKLRNQTEKYAELNKEYQFLTEELIIEREKAEENEIIQRSMVQNIPGMTYRSNPDWSVKVINNSKLVCGYETEDFLQGKLNWIDLILPEDKENVLDQSKILEKNQTSVIQEYRIIANDRSIRYIVDYKTSLFDDDNIFLGVDGIVLDTTEKKEIEQELINAKEKAEESDRLKSEFFDNMSHEVRTPLNGILGFSNFLKKPNVTDEQRVEYINIIQNSGHQLLQIIDDILEISKLGSNQTALLEEEVNVNDLLQELFSVFELKSIKNNIPLILKKGLPDTNSIIITDKTKLNRIVSNLLENAFKFTSDGYIEFGYKLEEGKLAIYVKDTGIGIRPEKQNIIFERFSQEEKELSQKVGGLGLGLSIAKEHAKLLGGSIRLNSEKGKGSTFYVTIPFKLPSLKSQRFVKSRT
ncbi:MAG: ATP-binding protein [Bacteroidota bacterium]